MTMLKTTRGDDETIDLVVTVPSTGATVDLTDCKVYFYVKAYRDDADADALLAYSSPSDGIEIAADQSADKGEATVTVASADTDDLAPGVYFWEVQVRDAAGLVHTVGHGRYQLAGDVVRSAS